MSNGAPGSPPTAALSRRTLARYAAGSIGTGGFATLPGLVLTYYLTNSLGVTAVLAGIIVTVAKIWDVLIDPVIGAISDRELRLRGSRRRLMLAGAVLLPICFALTFAVPPSVGPWTAAAWVLVSFVATATAFSLFQVPFVALPAELTQRYDERTRLLTWSVVVLTFSILLFGAGGPMLRGLAGDETAGYLLMGVVAGITLGAGMLVATTAARRAPTDAPAATTGPDGEGGPGEPHDPADTGRDPVDTGRATGTRVRAHFAAALRTLRASQPFRALLSTYLLQALATATMLACAQFYATWVLHSEDAITLLFVALIAPALLAAPAWGALARRIGKERGFAIATVLFGAATLSILASLWAPGDWIYLPVAAAGIAYAGMQSLPMAMLPDVISHDAASHGDGRAGAFAGVWSAGETTGFAFGAGIQSLVLAATGYVESVAGQAVAQPGSAVAGIVVTFSALPALLVLASLLTLRRYRLRKGTIDAEQGIATRPARDVDAPASA